MTSLPTTEDLNSKLGVSFEQLIRDGGDRRLDLQSTGLNKYNVLPTDFHGVFNRASCTCSPLTPDGYQAASELYQDLDEDSFVAARNAQTRTIKELINYKGRDRFDVFYAPSGSDLCYLPLLFSQLLEPDKKILNLTTCPEELGSGSVSAYAGKFYFSRNQMGDEVEKDSAVAPDLDIECQTFAARAENGEIINHWQEILENIHDRYHSHSVNANLVIGSKSGIENNVTIVSRAPEDVLWTIDLCQFRASRVLVNGLIGMNCLVMLTGSKFYQSPPFCAVLLVPKTITRRFHKPSADLVEPFSKVFSRHDIPERFTELRKHLPDFRNYGLLLRWQAALTEMTKLAELESFDVSTVIHNWNQEVVERLNSSKYFKMMPDQEVTNNTIISFRVRDSRGEYLSHDELTALYHSICQRTDLPLNGFHRALFGQPVKYGDRSFIRIALGASDASAFVKNGLNTDNDMLLIQIIEDAVESNSWK